MGDAKEVERNMESQEQDWRIELLWKLLWKMKVEMNLVDFLDERGLVPDKQAVMFAVLDRATGGWTQEKEAKFMETYPHDLLDIDQDWVHKYLS